MTYDVDLNEMKAYILNKFKNEGDFDFLKEGLMEELVDEMIDERRRINKIADVRTKAREYAVNVKDKYFDKLRYHCDKLEIHIDDEVWPLVKYRELLFAH